MPVRTAQAGERLSLQAGVATGVLPVLAAGEGGAETYTAVDLQGNTLSLTEAPRYSFFATTSADLDEGTADEPLPGTRPPDGLVRLTPLQPGSGTFWIVVRDGRGGVGWLAVDYDAT